MKRSETTPPMPEDLIAAAASTVHGGNAPTAPEPSHDHQHPGLSPAVQKHIGNLLKVSFQDLLTEPVPDRFANLLDQLEKAEKSNSGEDK